MNNKENENITGRIKGQKIQFGESFVLPIEQSRVTRQQAKVQQIINETDAKVQEIMTDAQKQAQEIIEKANAEAERIILQAQEQAQSDYDTVKNTAYNEGFEQGKIDGNKNFVEETEAAMESLKTLTSSSFDIKKNIIDSATRDIVDLVNAIALKVCNLSLDEKVLYNITVKAIKQLNDKEFVSIIVNPRLVENINRLSPRFKDAIKNMGNIKILEDNSLSIDGVIVESLNMRLDSRISSQITEITRQMLTGTNDGME